jgi:succinyl-CoA synthetase beta subunit
MEIEVLAHVNNRIRIRAETGGLRATVNARRGERRILFGMARLHEYEGKALLGQQGIAVPRGRAASTPDEAAAIATELGSPVVLKIQAWTTGRAAMGGVAFAKTSAEAEEHAARLLVMHVGAFPVESVLVEEQLDITREFFVSLSINDATRSPVVLFAASGGTGIEERAEDVVRLACDVNDGLDGKAVEAAITGACGDGVGGMARAALADALDKVFALAKSVDARSVEINPLVITGDGRVMAADCRMTIDDYAVYRQPNLGIEIARELDHPPTDLERAAYEIEQADHRGTFYFAQLNASADATGGKGLIGFHGAGGGGSMMSMDAIVNEGFTVANFCDTSGNPSAAKVYRAARIILSQPGLCGYFGSGSGVASQEQIWSAYGLAKAFWELELTIPAVVRLGGNSEDRAVEILTSASAWVTGAVEAYRKDDAPAFIAKRFAQLVESANTIWSPRAPKRPAYVGTGSPIEFTGGRTWIDTASCDETITKQVVEHGSGLFKSEAGVPTLAVTPEDAAGKDSEFIACEIELRRAGCPVVFVELDMPDLTGEGN